MEEQWNLKGIFSMHVFIVLYSIYINCVHPRRIRCDYYYEYYECIARLSKQM